MRFVVFFISLTFFGILIFPEINSAISFAITTSIALRIIFQSNELFMFREWTLLLYAVNYLFSPSITYQLDADKIKYGMKISSDAYFSLAIPGFLLFTLGMYIIPTIIFKPEFKKISKASLINEHFLFQLTILGMFLRLISGFFSAELAFFMYLLGLIRFVGVFALFALNSRKYLYLMTLIIGFEIVTGFLAGMFHDSIMWLIFFLLFFTYTSKPKLNFKILGSVFLIAFVLLIQAFKQDYRERVWSGSESANFETITDVGLQKANSDVILGEGNLLGTLNRGNQAWIFASTVNRMDRYKDFQGMNNVNKYLEAAFLPRFLAPNKIKSGERTLFNEFSGHVLGEGTSMGLGIFADGYIAYGSWGVYVFCFVFGLIFSLTFKLVERWTKISPFYFLLLLPMLNYAVRPDCELQTTINHLAKSIVVFGGLVYFTKDRFTLETRENQRKLLHLNLMK